MNDSNELLDTHAERRRAFLTRTAVAAPAVAVMLASGARPAFAQPYGTGTFTLPSTLMTETMSTMMTITSGDTTPIVTDAPTSTDTTPIVTDAPTSTDTTPIITDAPTSTDTTPIITDPPTSEATTA